ncbi:MAG: chaperone SurA [Bryobacteraceae bacterium]|nr:MAG: chaperone SurA [Bryobacteraceae bacterium]
MHWQFRVPQAAVAACLLLSTWAQPPAPEDDPVVVVMEGKPWRRKELEEMIRRLPPPVSQNFFLDKRNFLLQYALVSRLAKMAEEAGVANEEPHKTRLEYQRNTYLAQAEIERAANRIQITPDEQRKYFEAHKDQFARAQVKVIYLSFNDNPPAAKDAKAKRPRTSAEAEKLARDIVGKARAGADFSELARQYSDDEETKAKGGDYRPLKPADTSLPPEIRTAIFSLKPGQVSDPVRQTGGFWVFQLTKYDVPAFAEVQNEVFEAMREARFREWIEGVQKTLQVEFRDESYLRGGSPKN